MDIPILASDYKEAYLSAQNQRRPYYYHVSKIEWPFDGGDALFDLHVETCVETPETNVKLLINGTIHVDSLDVWTAKNPLLCITQPNMFLNQDVVFSGKAVCYPEYVRARLRSQPHTLGSFYYKYPDVINILDI